MTLAFPPKRKRPWPLPCLPIRPGIANRETLLLQPAPNERQFWERFLSPETPAGPTSAEKVFVLEDLCQGTDSQVAEKSVFLNLIFLWERFLRFLQTYNLLYRTRWVPLCAVSARSRLAFTRLATTSPTAPDCRRPRLVGRPSSPYGFPGTWSYSTQQCS